jgi:hypothetical protein
MRRSHAERVTSACSGKSDFAVGSQLGLSGPLPVAWQLERQEQWEAEHEFMGAQRQSRGSGD